MDRIKEQLQTSSEKMTLHQLRIFWSVAHAETLTNAAKQLGLTQPSLSQQISKLEKGVGLRLFDRTTHSMQLTDAGQYLFRRAEQILGNVEETQIGLQAFTTGQKGVLRVAGLTSLLRVLLPPAIKILHGVLPGVEFDVHEASPTEILELLYARRVMLGLLASNAIPAGTLGFEQTSLMSDPYVFAVPAGIRLDAIIDPDTELAPEDREIVNSSIQFNFGSLQNQQVDQWYQHVLPRHRLVAQCRSYDVALSFVQRGLGVCLLPAIAAQDLYGISGITLYKVNRPSRRLVSLLPAQYRSIEPYRSFTAALVQAGQAAELPVVKDAPPFLARDPQAGLPSSPTEPGPA